MIERFKNEKIAIRVYSQKEYYELMKLLEKHNFMWGSGSKPTKLNWYSNYNYKFCISTNDTIKLNLEYAGEEYHRAQGYKIIRYKDFIKGVEMKNKFTKKDLKDGDIVTYRNGWKRTVKGSALDSTYTYNSLSHFDNQLKHKIDSDLDIVKVERQEVVYERKEILDEAEKRYLRDVIRPFRNEVKYIILEKSCTRNGHCYINIEKKDDDSASLPYFKIGTMYKGMKLGKEYSLKELGL